MEKLPIAVDYKRFNENGILLLAVYFFLKEESGERLTPEDKALFNEIVRNLRTHKADGTRFLGLYDRGSAESVNVPEDKRRTISHDNISSIAAFSHCYDLPYHMCIYQHGVDNKWRFDNIYPDKPRISRTMHPRDIIYWSRLGGGKIGKSIAWCFMWVFYLSQIYSCYKQYKVRPSLWHKLREKFTSYKYTGNTSKGFSSSGKQLAYMRIYPLRKVSWVARCVWWACEKIVDRYGGFDYVFEHYYDNDHFSDHNPDHPIIKLAKRTF